MKRTKKVTYTYMCETCGSEYDDKDMMDTCDFCGKDICETCVKYGEYFIQKEYYTWGWDKWKSSHICESCMEKLNNSDIGENELDVEEEISALIEKRNSELKEKIMKVINDNSNRF